jgi:hypothetical protein
LLSLVLKMSLALKMSLGMGRIPDLFTSGLFLRLKLGLPVGLAGAVGPVRPQAGLTQSGNPDFNTQKEVLVSGPDIRC